ncbi:hypothetical protein G9A89_021325 [Geosiphon pyriformis]|nr:hypothetical protein G9A89_021325 [Geosiphon pyriformis]
MEKTFIDVVFNFPIIDNHAHPLLKKEAWLSFPLESAFTEAQTGTQASQDSLHSLALKSGLKKLIKLSSNVYGSELSLEAVRRQRDNSSLEQCSEACFKSPKVNIQCALFDDGLYGDFQPIKDHIGLVQEVRRVVRIERIAEDIVLNLGQNPPRENLLQKFEDTLKEQLIVLAKSNEVVAFKSVAAYRTGLSIEIQVDRDQVSRSLMELSSKSESFQNSQPLRINDKALIDFIVNLGIKIAKEYGKPIQFHTGFGDNDLDLFYSDPVHLKNLIEHNLDAKIVLLHSAYPYTRQAGFLASVYSNVYLDVSLIFSKLSHFAQLEILREAISLCPTNKILFSTDGHHIPETFYCAVVEAREALAKVLKQSVEAGELNFQEATDIAKKVLFYNANSLYNLSLAPILAVKGSNDFSNESAETIDRLRADGVKVVRLSFTDLSNIERVRMVPIDRFKSHTITDGISAAKVVVCLPYYADHIAPNTLGSAEEMLLKPDLSTLRRIFHPTQCQVSVFMVDKVDGEPFELCPRNCLKRILDTAYQEFGLSFLIGFESEFLLLKKSSANENIYIPVNKSAYCSSASFFDVSVNSTLEEIVDILHQQDIVVEQYHSESCDGQFELVTGPYPALESVDKLVLTRSTISGVAAKHGMKATFIPKFLADQAGTGAHLHLSLNSEKPLPPSDNLNGLSSLDESFIAGVLKHIRALSALTLPTSHSYTRQVDGAWSGSTYVAYGYENRETPIRICYRKNKNSEGGSYNLENRFIDCTANPYLATAGIIAAGLSGIRDGLNLSSIKPLNADPSGLSQEELAAHGVTQRMPRSLKEALEEFKNDGFLQNTLGELLAKCYLGVKEDEMAYTSGLSTAGSNAKYSPLRKNLITNDTDTGQSVSSTKAPNIPYIPISTQQNTGSGALDFYYLNWKTSYTAGENLDLFVILNPGANPPTQVLISLFDEYNRIKIADLGDIPLGQYQVGEPFALATWKVENKLSANFDFDSGYFTLVMLWQEDGNDMIKDRRIKLNKVTASPGGGPNPALSNANKSPASRISVKIPASIITEQQTATHNHFTTPHLFLKFQPSIFLEMITKRKSPQSTSWLEKGSERNKSQK